MRDIKEEEEKDQTLVPNPNPTACLKRKNKFLFERGRKYVQTRKNKNLIEYI
jgi:hypothetical protein